MLQYTVLNDVITVANLNTLTLMLDFWGILGKLQTHSKYEN